MREHNIHPSSRDNVKLVHKLDTTTPTACISGSSLAGLVALLDANEREELTRQLHPFVKTYQHVVDLRDRPIEVLFPKTERHCALLMSYQIMVDGFTSRIWVDCYEHDCTDSKLHEKLR